MNPINMLKIFSTLFVFGLSAYSNNRMLLAPTPPMGWNSYDSYGTYFHEKAANENLDVFITTFKPLGYEYFVIDGGWYIEYELHSGTLFPTTDKGYDVNIDKNGYFIPSKTYFPNGLKSIAEKCHRNGVKFGIHFLRGMPRKAVEWNTSVKGTAYFSRDIVNTNSICEWNPHTYGVDMSKPGAQEYYDGWIKLLADWGVDFVKADDITTHPDEIAAVQKAVKKCGRPMIISLSPGDHISGSEIPLYEQADMLRVTPDVWDFQQDIDACFIAWLTWQYVSVRTGFWFDMDMIPFGELQVMVPEGTARQMAGRGVHRFDNFTVPQKETFITMRAMAASPLMIGGVLKTLDSESMRLLTNAEMIACNQNGVMGHLVKNARDYSQIWRVDDRCCSDAGWIAVFNRTGEEITTLATVDRFGLNKNKNYSFSDIWNAREFIPGHIRLAPNGCLFLRFNVNTEDR